MKSFTDYLINAAAVLTFTAIACAQSPINYAAPTGVPPALVPSAPYLRASYFAMGTQNYGCSYDGATGSYKWTFIGPEANLLDNAGNIVGQHAWLSAADQRPYWQVYADGSYVVGAKQADNPSQFNNSVPYLLLNTVLASPAPSILNVSTATQIQRYYTIGGAAPTGNCTWSDWYYNQFRKVPYVAIYYFWGTARPSSGAGAF